MSWKPMHRYSSSQREPKENKDPPVGYTYYIKKIDSKGCIIGVQQLGLRDGLNQTVINIFITF